MPIRVTFSSPMCNGNVELTDVVADAFNIARDPQHAVELATIDQPPEAGGPVALADKDGYLRIQLLAAALYNEICTQSYLNPEAYSELKAASVHAQKADHWAKVAFRKNRMLTAPKAPPAPSPFPPKEKLSTVKRSARK